MGPLFHMQWLFDGGAWNEGMPSFQAALVIALKGCRNILMLVVFKLVSM